MAKTLEEYTSEISNSYAGTRNALQNQLDAIKGNLNTTNEQINKQYGLQQAQLKRNANNAASAASISAAGNGGSFGGNAAIANQKYYGQTFAPAMLSSQTNQDIDLANARSSAERNRLNLEGQLASLNDTIAQAAQSRHYEALEADRRYELEQQKLAVEREAAAQQNAYYQYLLKAAQEKQAAAAAQKQSTQQAQQQHIGVYNYGNTGLKYSRDYNPTTNTITNTIFQPV